MNFRVLSLILCVPLFFACGKEEAPRPEPPVKPSSTALSPALPLGEISQTLPLAYDELWEALLTVVQQHDLEAKRTNRPAGQVQTSWRKISEQFCELRFSEQAPLDCEVQYNFSLSPLDANSTGLRVRYEERCQGQEEIKYSCPGSNAEKKMKAMVEDLKAMARVE